MIHCLINTSRDTCRGALKVLLGEAEEIAWLVECTGYYTDQVVFYNRSLFE